MGQYGTRANRENLSAGGLTVTAYMNRLDEIIDIFRSVDPQMRLRLLLDYSRKLPPLPEKYHALRDAGLNRVPECQTPVFLYMEPDNGSLLIHVDVAEEAPTVQGFLSLLIKAFAGASREEIARVPLELLQLLGLADLLRMTRAVGLSAILTRIKREAIRSGENGGLPH